MKTQVLIAKEFTKPLDHKAAAHRNPHPHGSLSMAPKDSMHQKEKEEKESICCRWQDQGSSSNSQGWLEADLKEGRVHSVRRIHWGQIHRGRKKRKWPGGWMWGSSQKKKKKKPIRSCHREGNTARGSKGERERGWEKAFWREGGGLFLLLGFQPRSATAHSSGRKTVLCSHFSYHVVTLHQARGQVCSNEAPCACNDALIKGVGWSPRTETDPCESCLKSFDATLTKKQKTKKHWTFLQIKQLTVIWRYNCIQQDSLVRAWQLTAAIAKK